MSRRSLFLFGLLLGSGCLGYRSRLNDSASGTPPGTTPDSGAVRRDAASDVRPDGAREVGPDVRDGGPDMRDALVGDLGRDRPADVSRDAAREASVDARSDLARDVPPPTFPSCVGGVEPSLILLDTDGWIHQFDPLALTLSPLMQAACGSSDLNSMASSTYGRTFVSNSDGELCEIDVGARREWLTTFSPADTGNQKYGMALLPENVSAGQTLYIAASSADANAGDILMRIDLTTFRSTVVGPIKPRASSVELSAGPASQLYGFSVNPGQSYLLTIDPATAVTTDVVTVPSGYEDVTFASVYWKDYFFLFVGDWTRDACADGSCGTEVFRYRKGDSRVESLGLLENVWILGAGLRCP